MIHLLPYILDKLEKLQLKHEVHHFNSGAIMLDIWMNDAFYVIQIDKDFIGLSLITDNTNPFDITPDTLFSNETAFKSEFEKIFPEQFILPKKTLLIDGNNFQTLEDFYSEVDNVLTKDLDWATGHNLAAFNDLLRGGFGVHEYEEPVLLIWKNSAKSRSDLALLNQRETQYDILVSIIKDHPHIEFIEA